MMMEGIPAELFNSYLSWLGAQTEFREAGSRVEVAVPFMDRRNDFLQIIVERKENGFMLSDDGVILRDLAFSGWKPTTKARKETLAYVLRGYNVMEHDGALVTEADTDNFPWRFHCLLQAMLAVDSLWLTAKAHVASMFKDDVKSWLLNDLRLTAEPKFKIYNNTGRSYVFDFKVQTGDRQPARLLRFFNSPDKNDAYIYNFQVIDAGLRESDYYLPFALLDDSAADNDYSDVIRLFGDYGVSAHLWSNKDQLASELLGRAA